MTNIFLSIIQDLSMENAETSNKVFICIQRGSKHQIHLNAGHFSVGCLNATNILILDTGVRFTGYWSSF